MKTTTKDLLRAFGKASKKLRNDKEMTSSSASAGFIIPNGQKRGQRIGFQVFVQVCWYSEALLKRKPHTGGLLRYEHDLVP